MAQWMVIFGWCFIAAMIIAVLLPYLLRKSDLLTSWNLFLIGSINFVGFGAIYSGRSLIRMANYDDRDRLNFLMGAVVCYAALFAAYYLFRLPRRVARKHFNKWPPIWGPALVILLAFYLVLVPFNLISSPVVGVAQVLGMMTAPAVLLLVAYGFMLWMDRPYNVLLLVLLVLLGVASLLFSVNSFGRRPLLGLLLCPAICLYWLRLRYARPAITLLLVAAVGVGAMALTAGYSVIRGGRGSAMDRLQKLVSSTQNTSAVSLLDGDIAVECSCIAIHHYTREVPPHPFFTIWYVLANPIPRSLWPTKPEALGYSLPRDTGVWLKSGYVNWGPGIVGHGFHEGGELFGLPMLVFYGVLFGSLMRIYDDLLSRQPNNPFLIATLVAAAAEIMAFSRGDIGYFSITILGALITGLLIPRILRIFFGKGFEYAPDGAHLPEDAAARDYPQTAAEFV